MKVNDVWIDELGMKRKITLVKESFYRNTPYHVFETVRVNNNNHKAKWSAINTADCNAVDKWKKVKC